MNVRYPKEDRERNVQGKVIIKFIVEKDGTTSHFEVSRSPSKTMADEALRVIKLMPPECSPGSIDGNPVRSYGSMPLNFTLASN